MILFSIAVALSTLILLIVAARCPPFIAFVVAALVAAMMLGIPLAKVQSSIETGIGAMMGPLAVVVVLGAMFGKLVADSGAAQRIADSLVALLGARRLPIAMAITGFLVGIPLFYNVGFVLMVPLVFSVAKRAQLPAVHVGIPLFAGLSIAHGFLPPHPSPTALVAQFSADLGLTLIYGLIVGLPTLAIAGPLFAMTLKRVGATAPVSATSEPSTDRPLPKAWASFTCALLPVVLIAGATVWQNTARASDLIGFLGNPMSVLLVSVLVAMIALSRARGMTIASMGEGFTTAIRDIAPILLIIGGAGALKQVLVDSGADRALVASLSGLPVPPLVLGWLVALAIRIALGSATVAGLTAASLVQPLVASTGTNPNLMVLAVGAGSLMCSHVNDTGFWMFKEYLGLSLRDTFRSWSLMETLVGSFGLIFTLLLNAVI
jgi:Gnt-I system high-affinity gluconate transporter